MIAVNLIKPDDFDEWRNEARNLIAQRIQPGEIIWRDGQGTGDLFANAAPSALPQQPPNVTSKQNLRVSRAFIPLAVNVLMHRDPSRLGLLYRVLWALQEHPRLLEDKAHPDVAALEGYARQVRRDIHKMRAFLRFRSLTEADGAERYVAWFEPDHRIERANIDFFMNRFASQRWSILTPRLSLHWDGFHLSEGPPATSGEAPDEDATEELWLEYYRSTFNPARLKVGMMLKEMPRRYWKNLPEARAIPELIAGAQKREATMIVAGAPLFNDQPPPDLAAIAEGIAQCRRCAIGCNGTRAVMGEGPSQAQLMIVGEQPGDTEECEGRPFVGPAGHVLDEALERAGLDRRAAYVTNAVKHFKFAPRGKRRLHQTPTAGEIDRCRWWLDNERALVAPRIILALGASAARGLLGRTPALARERGKPLGQGKPLIWLTVHPSYLLRLDGAAREREELKFNEDLTGLARLISTRV